MENCPPERGQNSKCLIFLNFTKHCLNAAKTDDIMLLRWAAGQIRAEKPEPRARLDE